MGVREVDNLLIFNIVYNASIFSTKRHCVDLWGYYLLLFYINTRAAKLVEGKKKELDNIKKLFYKKAITLPNNNTDNKPLLLNIFLK